MNKDSDKDKFAYIKLQSNFDNKTFIVGILLLVVGLIIALGLGGGVAGIGIAAILLALVHPHEWDEDDD